MSEEEVDYGEDSLSAALYTSRLEREEEPQVSLLIDGDLLAYRGASVTDGRCYVLRNDPREETWSYKKDIISHCHSYGINVGNIELEFHPETQHKANMVVKRLVADIQSKLARKFPNNRLVVYLTGKSNFRFQVNPQYKENRKDIRRPKNLTGCKQFLVDNYSAEYRDNLEADDLLAMKATSLDLGNFVICSIDKDLKQIPGLHYDFVNDSIQEVSLEEGRRLLWEQVISGDSTDNIGSPRGLGKVAGRKLFQNVDFSTVQDEELFEMATVCYSTKMKSTLDHSDIRCFVNEVYNQVYLLRNYEELSAYDL